MKQFLFSVFFVLSFCILSFAQENPAKPREGNGIGNGTGGTISAASDKDSKSVRVVSKTRANYTDSARKNGIEGSVMLRVTFLATGEIGAISAISELSFGLTEQAIEAARKIKFQSAMKNGQPVTVVKQVQYVFSIYYNENDEDVAVKPEIIEMPAPEHPTETNLKNVGGKVTVEIILDSSGKVAILKINTNLSKEFEQKAAEAVTKIKFKPALHKNGKEISVTKVIEYEFKPQN